MNIREYNWDIAGNKIFDIVIIGAGINGASIFNKLSQQGYKALLIDKGDFSCGTSQSSAMMIWGGLLYLKNFDFLSVYNFSKDRDILINSFSDQVISKYFRYIPNREWGRNKYFVYLALHFYWMLGRFKRTRPKLENIYEELHFINPRYADDSIVYQEGFLKQSDSRFVLDWILAHQSENSLAINYCSIENGTYNNKDKLWYLDLSDSTSNRRLTVKSKLMLNCAGAWTDAVNRQFGILSPVKHVFSKGVFIGFERPDGHNLPLIFEQGKNGDVLTFIPWGPVSLWGPTETAESSIEEGYSIKPEDILFLLQHASKNLRFSIDKSKIVSLRCGLRPLAVDSSFARNCNPLDISRSHKIVEDPRLPWLSIYGGKISGCITLTENVAKIISQKILPITGGLFVPQKFPEEAPRMAFPNLREKVTAIDWCVNNEFCCTLEDYLRRRTNISQWVPREGLGHDDCHLNFIGELSAHLPSNEHKSHAVILSEYRRKVHERFDKLMAHI